MHVDSNAHHATHTCRWCACRAAGLPPADDVGRSPWLPAPSQIAEELRPRHQRRTRHVPSQHPRVEEQKHAGQRQQQADQSLPERAPQRSRTPAKQEQQQQGGLQQPDAPPAQPPIKRPQHRQAEGAKHRANSQQPSSHQPAQIKGRPSPATQPTPLLQPQPQARHHHPATQHSGPWQSADAHRQQARSSARTPPTPPPSSLSPTARVSPLHGRYLPQVPQTPAAALRLAADLAQLAGPDVGIRGPHIRGREQPVEARQAALRLTAVAGQSQDPWWQWKQWVQQRARRAAVVARLARSRGKLRAGGKAGTGGSLSVMLMDDWALDLDELEEGVTADALHGPQQDMVGQVAHDTWRQLRQLAAQMPAPNKQQRQQSKGAPSRRLQQGQGSRDQQGAAQGEKRDTGQGRAPKLETVPYLSIYKGGGYVAADLEFMLTRMGLSQVLRLHMHMQGAHCILAKQKWRSGRPVDLRQQEAAARRRGIPLLLVPSLSMRDVLTALRPLLLERGVLPDSSAKRQVCCY